MKTPGRIGNRLPEPRIIDETNDHSDEERNAITERLKDNGAVQMMSPAMGLGVVRVIGRCEKAKEDNNLGKWKIHLFFIILRVRQTEEKNHTENVSHAQIVIFTRSLQ